MLRRLRAARSFRGLLETPDTLVQLKDLSLCLSHGHAGASYVPFTMSSVSERDMHTLAERALASHIPSIAGLRLGRFSKRTCYASSKHLGISKVSGCSTSTAGRAPLLLSRTAKAHRVRCVPLVLLAACTPSYPTVPSEPPPCPS